MRFLENMSQREVTTPIQNIYGLGQVLLENKLMH